MSSVEPQPSESAAGRRCGVAELDAPESLWNRAAALAPQGDPFCCRSEWQLSFHEAFHPERALFLRQQQDSIIGFAERHDPQFGPLLEPIESHWLFGCPLLGPDALDLLDALLAEPAIAAAAPSVIVSGLLPATPLPHALFQRCQRRYRIFGIGRSPQVSASLAGGFDGYLSRRSGRLRRNVRAEARRAADAGVYYQRCAPKTADAAAAIFARALAVEQRSWKGIGRCGMAESPSREFYALMLRRLAVAQHSRVIFARCGEVDIGYIFGGLAGAVYRGQQFSFDDEWRAFSIGNLLQLEQLRWLCEEGIERYDMGPLMPYKRHWTEIETPIEAWLLQPGAGRR